MLEDPALDIGRISACLSDSYGLRLRALRFIPSYDPQAATYQASAADGDYLLKMRFGPLNEPALRVPRALLDAGVTGVLAPLRTRDGVLWAGLDDRSVVVFPFVAGTNATVVGLTDDQWRGFGSALRSIHDSGLSERFHDLLAVETFTLPSARLVLDVLALVEGDVVGGPVAARFAAFWRQNATRIRGILGRAEALAADLRERRFELVLCHADIHSENILVTEDGRLYYVDWDGPMIAPRERDLLFVIGSRIAREVRAREESLFFQGYGRVAIDPEALVYYRYERLVEDIGEAGKSVFLNPAIGEDTRAQEAALMRGFFAPGGELDTAESVTLHAPQAMAANGGP